MTQPQECFFDHEKLDVYREDIAEGNGKYAPKDRCRFFDIAHGSSLECAAGLDTLVAKGKLTPEQIRPRQGTLAADRPHAHRAHKTFLDARLRQSRPAARLTSFSCSYSYS